MTTAADLPEAPPSPVAAPGAWSPPLDADGRLTNEIGCRRCGYVLRGLRPDDRCPECDEPVADSLRGDLLLFADPAWLDRLLRGCKWLLAWLIAVVAVTMGAPFLWVLGAMLSGGGGIGAEALVIVLAAFAAAIPLMLAANAVFMLTSADPRQQAISSTSRTVARFCVFLALGLSLVATVITISQSSWTFYSPWSDVLLHQITTLSAQAADVAWKSALLLTVALLARRLPNLSLTRQLRRGGWCMAVIGGLAIVVTVSQTLYHAFTAPLLSSTSTQAPPPNLPAVQFPQPNPGTPPQTHQLQDGTTRTIYQQNDAASPNPQGLTIVDQLPDSTHRTSTQTSMPDGGTLVTDIVVDPAGTTFTTTTIFDSGGAVTSSSTSYSNTSFHFATGSWWLVFMVLSGVFGLTYLAIMVWGIVLLVWFYRKLRDTREAAQVPATAPYP